MITYRFVKSFRKGETNGITGDTYPSGSDGYNIYATDDSQPWAAQGGWWVWTGEFTNNDLELVRALAGAIPDEVFVKDLLVNHEAALKIRKAGWR